MNLQSIITHLMMMDCKFKSFSANNVYEWSLDGKTEYNILNLLQNMTMVATAYQTTPDCSDRMIVEILVAGFTGQLKGWWDNYLTKDQRTNILEAVKTDANGKIIIEDGEDMTDAVNTLIFTIAQHFIGDTSLLEDRTA